MKRVLVLGSSGLVGRALTKTLKKEYEVEEFDIVNGSEYDLRSSEVILLLKEKIEESDFIFFLAFDVGGSKYLAKVGTISYIDNNLKIMDNVFKNIGNKPFIFTSSQQQNMYNSYGTLKRLGEIMTTEFRGISVRLWNIHDTETIDEKTHVISDFIHQAKTDKVIKMVTDGSEYRQFLHAEDCSRAFIYIMNNYQTIQKERTVIDISSFKWYKIEDIANMIKKETQCKIIKGNKVDPTKDTINVPDQFILKYWKPSISLEDIIKKSLEQ